MILDSAHSLFMIQSAQDLLFPRMRLGRDMARRDAVKLPALRGRSVSRRNLIVPAIGSRDTPDSISRASRARELIRNVAIGFAYNQMVTNYFD